ncbi:MAG: hypothetical protein RIR70_1705 [Pseudomonadota bacterium]
MRLIRFELQQRNACTTLSIASIAVVAISLLSSLAVFAQPNDALPPSKNQRESDGSPLPDLIRIHLKELESRKQRTVLVGTCAKMNAVSDLASECVEGKRSRSLRSVSCDPRSPHVAYDSGWVNVEEPCKTP